MNNVFLFALVSANIVQHVEYNDPSSFNRSHVYTPKSVCLAHTKSHAMF